MFDQLKTNIEHMFSVIMKAKQDIISEQTEAGMIRPVRLNSPPLGSNEGRIPYLI